MTTIIFRAWDGKTRTVEAENGFSLMEVATRSGVPGIDADCAGGCSCATCHVYIDEAFLDKVGVPSEAEAEMLEFARDVRPNSRLSCQIKVDDTLAGLVVQTPESQS
jgi:ferredoxin, 2Fe-2S